MRVSQKMATNRLHFFKIGPNYSTLFLFFILFNLDLNPSLALPEPSQSYFQKEILEKPDNYIVYWSFNDSHVVFETHVKTSGFVGFGVSPNGGMKGSDIVIGGMRNARPYLEDRYAEGNMKPELDSHQDWYLLSGRQDGGYTILKFTRRLRSCDPMDRNITTGTTRLIWAYSDSTELSYHGAMHRGTKSVSLLSGSSKKKSLPADAYNIDFQMNKIRLPGLDTSYYCRAFRVPRNITSKEHIIKVEPIATPGNEKVVHHILLMACHEPVPDSHHGEQYECKAYSNTPSSFCYSIQAAWAIGSNSFTFPDDVGLGIGDGHITFFRIQMHYDNPTLRSDIVDSSGLRLWITPKPRKYDAGIIMSGMSPNNNLVIPPKQQEFTLRGWCPQTCFQSIASTHPEGITVFGMALHTHLLGIKVHLRHVRNGTELPPIAVDDNYDFDFQNIIPVEPNINVQATDSILTECVYQSTSRDGITSGGEGTREEMCNAFIFYYPRLGFSMCFSTPTSETIVSAVPGVEATATRQRPYFTVESPYSYVGRSQEQILKDVDWNNKTVAAHFQKKTLEGHINYDCAANRGTIEVPKINTPYVEKQPPCDGKPDTVMQKIVLEEPDKYVVYWSYNDTHIVFETRVKTLGYVGFGLSPNGGMKGSDIVIGGIRNGRPYLEDRYAVGESKPELDQQQDWMLLSGRQDSGYTILKFARRLRSCDPMDRNITTDTARLIWAYSETPNLSYHMNRRGTKSVLLLSPGDEQRTLPAESYSLDFRMNDISLPGSDTSYFCRAFRIPRNITSKHHIIRVDPITTPGNEKVVHHILLMACHEPVPDSHHGEQYECQGISNTPSSNCYSLIAAWAIGSPIFWYPDDVGLALGDGFITFLRIQMHYDNPTLKTGITDSSGLRLWMTPTPRRHDAGVIQAGMIPDNNLVIPPNQEEFTLRGWCTQNCFQSIKDTHPNGINVFAAGLHTHLIGIKARLRHIRDGTELPPIAVDENYDSDFQTFIYVEPTVKVMWTDSILTECVYNSKNRPGITMGGEGTREEMCNAFVLYYPRMNFSTCVSAPRPQTIISAIPGIQSQASAQPPFFSVNGPSKYVGMSQDQILSSIDWNNKTISQQFQNKSLGGNILYVCQKSFGVIEAPKITKPYVKPLPPCDGQATKKSEEESSIHKAVVEAPDKYIIFWSSNDSHIVIETHVKTTGYVGFGLSPNGGMKSSDMIVGGIKNGIPYLEDRYAEGNMKPELDSHQDWYLLSGRQDGGYTILKFTRRLRSCDPMDRNITEGTTKVIWAYSDSPNLSYHSTHRGSKTMHLLNPNMNTDKPLPKDAYALDIRMTNITIPAKGTTYLCQAFRVPKGIDRKQHIIKVDPIITPGNERLVHHIVLLACRHEIADEHHGAQYECVGFDEDIHPTIKCMTVYAVWAVGGLPYVYPDDVGLPIGDGQVTFFRMQMHYDNPEMRSGIVDASGLRLWLTPTLRRYDAGIMEVGMFPTQATIIPPGQPSFKLRGWCYHDCLKTGRETHPEGIKIVSALLHTHLLGRKVHLRHMRKGRELQPIAIDDNYDFDYQSYVDISPNVKVLPSDDLVVDCVYNSTDRTSVTWGGESTHNEMCMAFIVYYPAINSSVCLSAPTAKTVVKSIPGTEVRTFDTTMEVLSPVEYAGKSVTQIVRMVDWENETIAQHFQSNINQRDMLYLCENDYGVVPVPEISLPYVKKELPCDGDILRTMPTATEFYENSEDLDPGNYRLHWKVEKDIITFEVHVKTNGFVGFGLGPPNVQWPFNAEGLTDLIIGGVINGQAYFKDSYSEDSRGPTTDPVQDWKLLSANQSDEFTVLKFSRPVTSCDDSFDRNITTGSSTVIWLYSKDNMDDLSMVNPGSIVRGRRSLNLLGPVFMSFQDPKAQSHDFVTGPYASQSRTVMICREFPVPVSKKNHIIRVETLVKPEHRGKIMYMLIFGCKSKPGHQIRSDSYSCPPNITCDYMLFMWNSGPTVLESLPSNVGLPIGDGAYDYIKIHVHFEVRDQGTDFEGSGFRLWMTPDLRQHDAGWMFNGLPTSELHIVPPQYTNFISQGHCVQQCMEKMLEGQPDGIHVVGVVQHAHVMAKAIRTRHFRNEKEQPYLAVNNNFDTVYQPFYYLPESIQLLKTDRLTTECVYDTAWRKKGLAVSLDVYGEMCYSYLLYYPRLDISECLSQPTNSALIDALKDQPGGSASYSGMKAMDVADNMDWRDQKLRQRFQTASLEGEIETFCRINDKVIYKGNMLAPQTESIYRPKEPKCGVQRKDDGENNKEGQSTTSTSGRKVINIVPLMALLLFSVIQIL